MLFLKQLKLVQFRNYLQAQLDFTEKIVGICGTNGSGKTNLLDAIYYLGFTKGYFTRTDNQNVHHGMQGMRLQGNFSLHEESYEILNIIRETGKKEFTVNATPYKKYSEHIGKFPCVMIAPDDIELVIGGSEERRKLIDTILSQIDTIYLQNLIDYNKILQNRNSFLKQAAESGNLNESLLAIYNEQLSEKGDWIFHQRQTFLKDFLALTISFYTKIAGKNDSVTIEFESDLKHTSHLTLLHNSKEKDVILCRTTKGTHKDELTIKMDNQPFKIEASQGQRKSLLFALKLAEWETLKQKKGFSPILLLDDVFEKLDKERMHNLLEWVCTSEDGQVFITDTHMLRLKEHLSSIDIKYQLIELGKKIESYKGL